MRLSKKADYALRVLFTLVDRIGLGPVSMNESGPDQRCAEAVPRTHHARPEVAGLGRKATPGRHGGYVLAQSPERITMGQVIRFFDGLMAPIGCVSISGHEPCSQATDVSLSPGPAGGPQHDGAATWTTRPWPSRAHAAGSRP